MNILKQISDWSVLNRLQRISLIRNLIFPFLGKVSIGLSFWRMLHLTTYKNNSNLAGTRLFKQPNALWYATCGDACQGLPPASVGVATFSTVSFGCKGTRPTCINGGKDLSCIFLWGIFSVASWIGTFQFAHLQFCTARFAFHLFNARAQQPAGGGDQSGISCSWTLISHYCFASRHNLTFSADMTSRSCLLWK